MGVEPESMMIVRAELCDRLESLQAAARRLTTKDFTARTRAIRTIAAAYGLDPVVRLADALDHAIAESEGHQARACPTALYLARLQDAIGCERHDEEASQAMLASVSVRLA